MGRLLAIPALAVLVALVIGGLIMIVSNEETREAWGDVTSDPLGAVGTSFELVYDAYYALFDTSLNGPNAIGETIAQATPLIFAGLAVAFAFKVGMFNIGAQGQLLMGATFATYVGFTWDLPMAIHLPLALVAGIVGGAVWGGIVGVLKAWTGAHEVITTIMLNFVALSFVSYLLTTSSFLREGRGDPISPPVAGSAELPAVAGTRAHLGFIIALLVAWLTWWILFRTTIGFKLRTVGANPDAATYAGISVAAAWILAMAIAGGIAGLGGGVQILGVNHSLTTGVVAGLGFDAIALALLGRSHPAGVVGAALLFGMLRAGAVGMQARTSVPVDIIVVIQALIILFVAAPILVRQIFRIRDENLGEPEAFSTSWGS
ncbi:MAG: ABC transporter permease [Hyphomicrobiales bacterium]|nr:ABC transporter permease [Hyphomicrobiales bacterium]